MSRNACFPVWCHTCITVESLLERKQARLCIGYTNCQDLPGLRNDKDYVNLNDKWRVNHTSQFRHHSSESSATTVWKVMGQHLFLNIFFSNFTARTGQWWIWCDRGVGFEWEAVSNQWVVLVERPIRINVLYYGYDYNIIEQILCHMCLNV